MSMLANPTTLIYRDWDEDYVKSVSAVIPSAPFILANYPSYATEGAGAMDLRAFIEKETILRPGEKFKVSSGLRMQLPDNFSLIMLPRSGSGSNGLVIANTVGLVDRDYRGVVWLTLWNVSNQAIVVKPLDRVLQAAIVYTPQTNIQFVESAEDLTPTARGTGGFGSTGVV